MSYDMMMSSSTLGNKSDKLGVTTNVTDEVDSFETIVESITKQLQIQRKLSEQLQSQLRRLKDSTSTEHVNTFNQVNSQVSFLARTFKAQNGKQTNQMDFLQIQSKTLNEQQQKLQQLSSAIDKRTFNLQRSVGV